MGFENIQFNKEQIADLFGSRLVITGPPDNTLHKTEQPDKNPVPISVPGLTGKNKKQFLWLVEETSHPYLSDADFQFLTDVLTACKMNMEDIALVNLAKNAFSFEELLTNLAPKHLVVSTVNDHRLPFQTADYLVQQQAGYQLCCTEPLAEIRSDKTKKSKLWLALKQMLSL